MLLVTPILINATLEGTAVKTALWSVFGVVFLVYLVTSGILLFHWRKYGMRGKKVVFAELVYLLVSVQIVLVALFVLNNA